MRANLRKNRRQRVVIDACVAGAAGEMSSANTGSRQCRDFLEKMLASSHHLVMSRELSTEWNRHQSRYARLWRRMMISQKRMVYLGTVIDEAQVDRITRICVSPRQVVEVRKDTHLLVAALRMDRIVISIEERVRALFHRAALDDAELQTIAWLNPTTGEWDYSEWVKGNITDISEWHLGHE